MIHRDPEARRQKWYATLGGVLLFVALGVAGAIDAADQGREESHYCMMVDSGAWPPYRDEIECHGDAAAARDSPVRRNVERAGTSTPRPHGVWPVYGSRQQ